MAQFFHPVVATKNTYKVAEKIKGGNGEDVENVIRKAFQCAHVKFQYKKLCNIRTDNALNGCKMSDMFGPIGKFDNRRH